MLCSQHKEEIGMDIVDIANKMIKLSNGLSGHLTEKEVRFLSCLPFLSAEGELLEIGSFKGKSTIILASAAKEAGMKQIVACDPLLLSSPTDPKDADPRELPEIFKKNLVDHNLLSFVEFHQKKSSELAAKWDRPIKGLWIDGDHTYAGATMDIDLFSQYLEPGGIICLHDVLHSHEGPIRAFIEKVILSEKYAECGCCGSIGWGQYIGGGKILTEEIWRKKLRLYGQLSRLVPFCIKSNHAIPSNKLIYKIMRTLVPHREIHPAQWIEERNTWAITSGAVFSR
jgi:hypothetical protein